MYYSDYCNEWTPHRREEEEGEPVLACAVLASVFIDASLVPGFRQFLVAIKDSNAN